jgi:HEAT repeat protein
MAAFFLSLHDTPHYADRVTPLLSNDETAGAAMRALGKWHVKAAVTNIVPYLKNEKEGRRIAAVNALRDIGDPAAIPYLMPLLNDPIFTVREVAARALSTLGPDAEKALLAALPDAQGLLRLYLIRTLGVMESRRAVGSLRRCLKDPDPVVRTYAQKALAQIGAD